MRIGILTNEYPPHVYGGAGVHVEYLTRELAALEDGRHSVDVLCFGDQRDQEGNLRSRGPAPVALPSADPRHEKFLDTMLHDLVMAGTLAAVDVVHCHTWYTHLAGCLVSSSRSPLVLTTTRSSRTGPGRSSSSARPTSASSWVERTAYQNADGVIAVSESMREDVHDALRRPARQDPRHPQRDRPEPVPADARPRGAGAVRDRPGQAVRPVRRPDHAAEGDHPPGQRDQAHPARASRSSSAPGPPTPRRSAARWPRRSSRRAASRADPIIWIRADRPQGRDHPALHPRGALRLPVGLRAVRDHQPRGDGLRDAGGGLGRRRDQGGRRPRQDRACSSRSSRSARPTSSRRTRRSSPATWPRPSTACSTTRSCAAVDGRASRASGSSTSSAGRASPARPSTSTAI